MKYIIIILAFCLAAKADTKLVINPYDKGVTITATKYPKGKAIALLVSDSFDRWVMATKEDGSFYLHYSRETNEPISWKVPVNNGKAFFKVIVLEYKINE